MNTELRIKEEKRKKHRFSLFFPTSYFILHTSSRKGFTIVEMIVAFGIFSVIMAVSVGSLASLLEANHKARALKTVVNNLHFAFENISRNVRTGSLYHCDITEGELTKTRDCANNPASSIIFTARNGKRIVYKYIPVVMVSALLAARLFCPDKKGCSSTLLFSCRLLRRSCVWNSLVFSWMGRLSPTKNNRASSSS